MNELAIAYKKQTASRYLPINNTEMKSKIMEAEEYAVSTKYDGHLYLLHFDGKSAKLYNAGQRCIDNAPLLIEAQNTLKSKCESVVFAGELYVDKAGERSRSFDLAACLDDGLDQLSFVAFDLIQFNGAESTGNIKEIDEQLKSLLAGGKAVHAIEHTFVSSRSDIETLYNELVVEKGQEGIIVKSDHAPTYKIKPLITLDAVVLGYAEGEGSQEGMLREVLVGLCTDTNEFLNIARVGNGFSDAERKDLLAHFEAKKMDSNYLEVAGTNVAFTMVKPEEIIEFTCLDVITENSKGTIKKMTLHIEDGVYDPKFKSPSVSVIAPVFVKFRKDKKANTEDAGISQVNKIISLTDGQSQSVAREKSTVLHREVYVKESKGNKMVRKFVVWKTNKENSGEYPAYVYHYTDFSPTRKDMLKKEVKVSSSKAQIESYLKTEISENIKKGWEKV